MDADKTLVIPGHVMSRQIGDETVILDLGSGTYFSLDAVGARVWQLLTEGHQVPDVVATLLSEFQVEPDQLGQDVEALVNDLLARGLLVSQ